MFWTYVVYGDLKDLPWQIVSAKYYVIKPLTLLNILIISKINWWLRRILINRINEYKNTYNIDITYI